MTWLEYLLSDEINGIHVMMVTIYVIFLKYWTWKHDTDCADDDNAGKDDQLQWAGGGRDRKEETERRYAI